MHSKTKIAGLVIGGLCAISAGTAVAGTTFDTHRSVDSGTASDATSLTGTITHAYVGPTWERGNAANVINLPGVQTNALTDGMTGTITVGESGADQGQHAVFSLRTSAAFKGNTGGVGINGVAIDLMNRGTPVTLADSTTQFGSSSLLANTADLAIMSGGSPVGTATVPIAYGTLYQSGNDAEAAQTGRTCHQGSLLSGNLVPASLPAAGAGAAPAYNVSRTMFQAFGLRSNSDAAALIRDSSSGNTADSATTEVSAACDKPTATNSTQVVDSAVFVRAASVQLRFDSPVTTNLSYSIPLSFRVTYI